MRPPGYIWSKGYYDWLKYAPCDIIVTCREIPVPQHPRIVAIRNKRQRKRKIREIKRYGIETYLEHGAWIKPTLRP